MGYYTRYRLEFDAVKHPDVLKALLDGFHTSYGSDWLLEIATTEAAPTKWYAYRDDMKRLSAAFPNVLFTLHGEGEQDLDLWREYWLGGKYQRVDAAVTYAPFDADNLIDYESPLRVNV